MKDLKDTLSELEQAIKMINYYKLEIKSRDIIIENQRKQIEQLNREIFKTDSGQKTWNNIL